MALDDALKSLEALDARQSRVVELRFFGGLSLEEAAHVLDVSVAHGATRLEPGAGLALPGTERRVMNAEQYQRGRPALSRARWICRGRAARLSGAAPAAVTRTLRREVESLLRAHDEAGDFIATPAMNVAARVDRAASAETPGR